MVWPVVAIAAVGVVSAAYSEYQRGEISREEFNKRKALAKRLEDGLRAPSGQAKPFTPEEYADIQKYAPQIATFVQENRPSLIKEAVSQKEIRTQQEGLDALRSRASSGRDVIADAQREEALFEADARAKGRREQILRDMANRGLSGSGQDILAQLQGSQDAAVGARQASLDAVKQAEARRLSALGDMTNLAGSIRGQNRQVEQTNVDIMNSYNQRLANAQNLYNQSTANTQNDAQKFNIANQARVSMGNTDLRNNAEQNNLTRQEQAQKDLLDFENDKLKSIVNTEAGIAAAQGQAARDRVAGTNQLIQSGLSGASQVYSGYKADQVRAAERAEDRLERQRDRDNAIDVANAKASNRSGGF